MSNTNDGMSLDEIIREKKSHSSGGVRGGRSRGGGQRGNQKPATGKAGRKVRPTSSKSDSPSEKRPSVNSEWKHDKFVAEVKNARSANRKVIVKQDHSSESQEVTVLEISNLHYNVTEDQLGDLFRKYGGFKKARINFDNSGRSNGTGAVIFVNRASANKAFSDYDGVELEGSALSIQVVKPEGRRKQNQGQGERQSHERGSHGRNRGRGRGSGRGSGRGNSTRGDTRMTSDSLDEQLESYNA